MKTWFENLKISRKIIFGYLITVIIALAVGVTGIISIQNINKNATLLYQGNTLALNYLGTAYADLNNVRYTSLRLTTVETAAEKSSYTAKVKDLCADMDDLLKKYEGTYLTSSITDQYKNTEAEWAEYKTGILQAAETGTVSVETARLGDTLESEFEQLMSIDAPAAKVKCDKDTVLARDSTIFMVVILVAGAVISILLGRGISNMISRPMQKFAAFGELLAVGDVDMGKVTDEKDKLLKYRKDEVGILADSFNKVSTSTAKQAREMQAIADGDLTTEVTVRSENDAIGKALAVLTQKFHSLAVSISSSADEVDSSAKQVAISSTSLSQGATEQASSIEELTASLEEITAQTTQNAQNARNASELSEKVRNGAETGSGQMAEMLKAMEQVNTSAVNIKKINKVIEDIAFQTNILALNAAVEAARAGEHGKGFAVVANEVKALAGKSADAAKETTDLIESSIRSVEAGSKIANETADSLREIVSGIVETTDLITSIASASNEQSSALEQIGQSVTEVSQVVQSNAAMSEEVAAASEELSGQADLLKGNVSIFKTSKPDPVAEHAGEIKTPDKSTPKSTENCAENSL